MGLSPLALSVYTLYFNAAPDHPETRHFYPALRRRPGPAHDSHSRVRQPEES